MLAAILGRRTVGTGVLDGPKKHPEKILINGRFIGIEQRTVGDAGPYKIVLRSQDNRADKCPFS